MNPKLKTLSVFITSEPKNPVDSHCLLFHKHYINYRSCPKENWDTIAKCRECIFAESNHKHGLAVSETIHEQYNKST